MTAVAALCAQVWPRSHVPIWFEQWRGFRQGQLHSMFRDGGAPSGHLSREDWICGGYASPEIARVKQEGAPFECCGPAGTVILWRERDQNFLIAFVGSVFDRAARLMS